MIKIENTDVYGWAAAIRGMRNPMNSWERSDSELCKGADGFEDCHISPLGECPRHNDFRENVFCVGHNDLDLMERLAAGGAVHAKYRRMITVTCDITAPLYWWKEFDTYKVGTVANSCSTMHKIHSKEFTLDDFSCEHLFNEGERKFLKDFEYTVHALNMARTAYLETKDKKYWWQMIQLLPSSYNQRRTVQLNYEVLHGIYFSRKAHKLDEWRKLCAWIEKLPYSTIITAKEENQDG